MSSSSDSFHWATNLGFNRYDNEMAEPPMAEQVLAVNSEQIRAVEQNRDQLGGDEANSLGQVEVDAGDEMAEAPMAEQVQADDPVQMGAVEQNQDQLGGDEANNLRQIEAAGNEMAEAPMAEQVQADDPVQMGALEQNRDQLGGDEANNLGQNEMAVEDEMAEALMAEQVQADDPVQMGVVEHNRDQLGGGEANNLGQNEMAAEDEMAEALMAEQVQAGNPVQTGEVEMAATHNVLAVQNPALGIVQIDANQGHPVQQHAATQLVSDHENLFFWVRLSLALTAVALEVYISAMANKADKDKDYEHRKALKSIILGCSGALVFISVLDMFIQYQRKKTTAHLEPWFQCIPQVQCLYDEQNHSVFDQFSLFVVVCAVTSAIFAGGELIEFLHAKENRFFKTNALPIILAIFIVLCLIIPRIRHWINNNNNVNQ